MADIHMNEKNIFVQTWVTMCELLWSCDEI